ncbi:MAG: nucleoside diphosphate kinase regulator [Bauldia sp.]|nr:nucleoside diphosphate kinase regulator [Bauldia sp.]
MTPISDFNLSPEIVIGQAEHRQLVTLALTGTSHSADEADWLLFELDRARLVPDGALPANVVRMGSTVRFRAQGGGERIVRLVYPGEADIAAGRISVLTPVGAALIGLREGQSITYLARDGRRHALTVLAVDDGPDGDDPGPLAA